jgi:hypothetical protein
MEILAGNPDLQGLCLALSDWHGELRLLEKESDECRVLKRKSTL